MDLCPPGLRCSLLPLFLLILAMSASGTQRCAPRALPDMVIDISLAAAQGARFTDPLKVADVEECVSACCRQLDAGGDGSCNLLVYDARTPGLQKCYLFHCPTLDACPLTSRPGVLSYSFWSDPSLPGKHDPDKEQQKPMAGDRSKAKASGSGEKESGPPDVTRKTGSVIASQVSAEHKVKEDLADTSKSITSQLLHLAEEMDQHLEKMESEDERRVPSSTSAAAPAIQTTPVPVHREVMKLPFNAKAAKPGKARYKKPEDLPTYHPTEAAKAGSTTPERATPRRSTAAPHPVPRTSHGVPPAATHRVSGTKEVPSTKLLGSDHTASTVSPTEVPALATAHRTRPPQLATRPAPSWTSPWKGIKLSTKNNDQPAAGDEGKTPGRVPPESYSPAQEEPAVNLEEAPRKVAGAGSEGVLPPPGDKSGLVAALIFGMLFLMVVIGLVSRKVSEARRRHRYTKLDYLINGMYVDT